MSSVIRNGVIDMWRDYSSGYIKNNRASGMTIIIASLISALFLSFLCSLFYSIWVDEVDQIIREEGDWQGRITGEISGEDLLMIRSFGNVERAVINEELSEEKKTVVDIHFKNARTIFQDMPVLTRLLGHDEDAASYHLTLLSRYLIHDPQVENPPLLMTFYLMILFMVSLSLIMIIRNSFAWSMDARIHQFGIFTSVGATPRQIRTCLMQEAASLCLAPILIGILLGIALSYGVNHAAGLLAVQIQGGYAPRFSYHPLVFLVTLLSSLLTVLFSAWLPARKLSRLTPLEAIRNPGKLSVTKKRNSPVLSLLFGLEGELAGNALKGRKKALRTSTVSLTLSFLGFTMMMCFFTLSDISTQQTYFARYQDAWDVMVTVKDTDIVDFGLTEELAGIEGVRDLQVYQKAEAITRVFKEDLSPELISAGGPDAVSDSSLSAGEDGSLQVKAPLMILDDAAFTAYCKQAGAPPRTDGTIILNQIWDSVNSNFRYKQYLPFIKERDTLLLMNAKQQNNAVKIPVIAYTQETPVLREDYEEYTLVQFIPLSLWNTISGQIEGTKPDTQIRILAGQGADLAVLDALEKKITRVMQSSGLKDGVEIENRIREKIMNDKIISGYKIIIGGLCVLLAFIGIANVFSNTLGFLRHRKREIAQYLSVGVTPSGIKKMFCIEAIVIAGRPLLLTLPLTVAAMGFMITASFMDPMEYIAQAPVLPIIIFSLVVFGFVGMAYYLGGRKVLQYNLSDALRDDTMV